MERLIDGLPIVNASKKIILHVTNADLKTAKVKSPNFCVLAQCAKRDLKAKDVRVHLSRVYLKLDTKKWVRLVVPSNLRSEIVAFDRGGRFAVGSFVLLPPAKSQKKGQQGADKPKGAPRFKSNKKRMQPHKMTDDVRAVSPY